ncbi:MAG: AAA family ATPase [Clostridia bacterium]|nr:AAA family ATPase [Clostridia bacterium]
MSEKIQETKQKLKDLGYFASDNLSKLILLFEASGKRDKKSIPTLLLQGKSGAGKTFLAETFAKMIGANEKFVQCFPRMGTENFQYDVNIEGVMKQDADSSIKEGILLQAIQQSKNSPVVLVIDELDKARPEVDSFLLDFLENGRLTTGTDTYEKGEYPIYTFITSNDKREIDEALINRSKKIEVPRPEKKLFLEILGLPEEHYLGYIYDKCPNFSIRQAKQYLEDLEILETEIDEDALSQYINLDELNVTSLADLQRMGEINSEELHFESPNLEVCQINISQMKPDKATAFVKLLKESGEEFDFESEEMNSYNGRSERILVNVVNTHQLELLKEYGLADIDYKGWFEHDISDEDMESGNIIWAGNVSLEDGTRFGVKIDGNRMYRIAKFSNRTFVYLNSINGNSLEHFLGQIEDDVDHDYKTDSDYDDDDDYDYR